MKSRSYTKMKDSGIEWLGEIPEHWNTMPIWILFILGRGRVISHLEIADNIGPFPVFSSQTENNGVLGYLNSFDFEGDYLTWTTDGANAGTVFSRTGRFSCTNVCGTLQGHTDVSYTFFSHALNQITPCFVRHDINPKLMNNVMASIRVQVPPLPEQHAIAAFLDRETARIDTLIEKKERQIELLQEKRTALISHAVTKGLDPNVKMKDSGIEWLGEIPEHWEVCRLKHLCQRSALYGANEPATSYVENGVRFLRTTDIAEDGNLVTEGVHLEPESVRDYILADGDLLISRSGTIGRAFLYDFKRHGPCAYAGYLVRFVPGPSLVPRFMFYYLKSKSFEQWLGLSVIASTIGNVNGQKYANMYLCHPITDEQHTIAAFLDRETARIDKLVEKVHSSIALLREYRTALISAAVTGKIDVRNEIN